MKRFITADWHCGEDRFEIMQRYGFKNAQNMVDTLVRYHNELVSPDDLVYVVGDAVSQNSPEFLNQVSRFNGKKILFRGNHDRVFTNDQLRGYFEKVYEEKEGLEIDVDGLKCWIQHYPTEAREDMFNLVGHIHGAWKVQLNCFNIGVDANHYRPHDIDKAVPFMYTAICKFYDNDVWVAYDKANANFKEERGKKGRYLDIDGLVGG
jgi:calcineurin-like phosphoesterase family protein